MIHQEPVPLRPRTSNRRRLITLVVIGFVVLLLGLRSIATFWTDYLWFDSLGLNEVWRTLTLTKMWLVLVATVVAAALIWVNLWLADRLSPRDLLLGGGPDDELLERWHEWVGPRETLVRIVIAIGLGLMLGLGASLWWQDFLMFRHGGDFGMVDPLFNNDIGLYVFDRPFYRSLFGWLFQLGVVILLVVAVMHYLNGGIAMQGQQRRVSPGVKVHLSVILAVLALLKAVGYWLDTWDLLYSQRGAAVGATYTDVNAQLPALRLLILISIVAAIILLINIWFRGWTLPLVALGLWLFTSIIVGGLYPTIIQRFQVVPDEVNKEETYVGYNIEATREGFGLSEVEVRTFAASPDLTVEDLDANEPTISNIRLWDPTVLQTTYRELQNIRTFYGINDVDVDRYTLDGQLTQVMVSARELAEDSIPGSGWVNETLVYTHGFGAVLAPANAVNQVGQPEFLLRDIPPITTAAELTIDQPRIYFSDTADAGYLIVDTNQDEVDYPVGESEVERNRYDGTGGVDLGGALRRAAWALRFGDVDVLISGQLREDSKVLLERNIRDRVTKVAPFLEADADPYLVISGGRLVWVMDLYTTSDDFPYSSFADTSRLNRGAGLPANFNYIRNSVKATVDAFTGEMALYVIDESDPLIQAQRRIFPQLFSADPLPADLREHLRYPEDLFRVQSDMYLLYHMTDPRDFFSGVDPWEIASDPSNTGRAELRGEGGFVDTTSGETVRPMLPYYMLMRLPDEEEMSFLIMQPFTPRSRPNMVSFMVAKSGPSDYGQIIDFRLPAQSAQQGPGQVGQFINQDPEISAQFTLLSQGGSDVIEGNMLVVPIEESLLYVQPIYIRASSGGGAGIPEFKRVVVSFNGQIEMAESLGETLEIIFGGSTQPEGPGEPSEPGEPAQPGEPGGELPAEVVALLDAADEAFREADAFLTAGDLAGYAASVEEARGLLEQALALIDGAEAP